MNWLIFIVGISLSVAIRMFTKDQVFNLYPSILTGFFTGLLFMGFEARRKVSAAAPKIDPQMITLKRTAIQLFYLSQEGTLSKTGNTVRFDAEGPDAANDFMDAIIAIVETQK